MESNGTEETTMRCVQARAPLYFASFNLRQSQHPQQVYVLFNVAGAHDEWLSEGGRDPSVSVLAAVTEAVKGEWANYDANMQHWTPQKRQQHRERWRTNWNCLLSEPVSCHIIHNKIHCSNSWTSAYEKSSIVSAKTLASS